MTGVQCGVCRQHERMLCTKIALARRGPAFAQKLSTLLVGMIGSVQIMNTYHTTADTNTSGAQVDIRETIVDNDENFFRICITVRITTRSPAHVLPL